MWLGRCRRSFCPSCEKKRSLLWAEWLRQEVLEPVPHRHVVVTIPRLLRPLFRRRRELLRDLARCAADALGAYVQGGLGKDLMIAGPFTTISEGTRMTPTP